MKKWFVFIFVLIISLSGCQQEISLNKKLSEKVKIVEEKDYLFSKLEVTYEDYKEATKDIISDSCSYIENKLIYGYTDNGKKIEVRGIDLKGLSKEEFKKHKQKWNELVKKFNLKLDDDKVTIRISGSYDANVNDKDYKYVYSQQIRESNDKENSVYIINKRYTFEKQDDSWKIINIDSYISSYSDKLKESGLSKNELISKMKYGTHNNKAVEYILSFALKE
ncbi:hypothetical protein [Thermohalobacter berrensis]|uniref:Lipoprotein n=1 Tax=Thermohalobacter berrensis TaxID=99594 RepID=A0A419T7L7_9FIRM|nr:hypothetical protein [Thermohalobacter berrensis]RKD33435.1 hypothetical protein BET03_09280 [Thermohalobacter berrensis]